MNKELLDLYTDYLISSFSQTTATGLSRLLDRAITHDVVTNFLAEEDFTAHQLWKLVKKDIRNIESEDGCLIFDDTILEKPYTDENEIVCYHFDHTKGRNVKGINLLNCLYYSRDVSIPLSFEAVRKEIEYIDPKSQKLKRKSKVTKNEMLRTMLQSIRKYQISFRYVLADIWFASTETMNYIKKELKKDFIMAMKANRLVALSHDEKQQGRFHAISELDFEKENSLTVYVKGVEFPILLTKQVFKNKDESEGTLYLVCSDLSVNNDQIQSTYQKRWKIEEFHKSIKSNTGLGKSPTRVPRTQNNHFFASIYAFVKLERLRVEKKLNHFSLKSKLYINALKASFQTLEQLSQKAETFLEPPVHKLCA